MSTAAIESFKHILASSGYRLTQARLVTFRLLLNSKPQSIADLLRQSSATVDRVSVYRNLALFEKLGIVNRVYSGWKYKLELSDDFVHHHHHLTCLSCGSVIDIEDEGQIDQFIRDMSERFGFSPTRHQFEIEGYCGNCRAG